VEKKMTRSLVVCTALVGLLACADEAFAGPCVPDKMLRITYSNNAKGITPDSFAAQPKTIYRLGSRYGRIEEQPDVPQGIHGLVIVNEPDMWVINLARRAGQHMVDGGPTYFFRAPLLTDPASPFFMQMEFGCEIGYLTSLGATPQRFQDGALSYSRYEVSQGDERITVLTTPDGARPTTVQFMRGLVHILSVHYLEYQTGLPTNPDLFQPPAGISVQSTK